MLQRHLVNLSILKIHGFGDGVSDVYADAVCVGGGGDDHAEAGEECGAPGGGVRGGGGRRQGRHRHLHQQGQDSYRSGNRQ